MADNVRAQFRRSCSLLSNLFRLFSKRSSRHPPSISVSNYRGNFSLPFLTQPPQRSPGASWLARRFTAFAGAHRAFPLTLEGIVRGEIDAATRSGLRTSRETTQNALFSGSSKDLSRRGLDLYRDAPNVNDIRAERYSKRRPCRVVPGFSEKLVSSTQGKQRLRCEALGSSPRPKSFLVKSVSRAA